MTEWKAMSEVKVHEAHSTSRFGAELDEENRLILPEDAGDALIRSGKTMVEGTVDGFPFRATLEEGRILLTDALRRAAGVRVGEMAAVELTRFGDEREVRVPADFRRALSEAPEVGALFEQITPMARREWVRWIASANQEKTRQKRIEVGIDKLSKGMRRPCCFPGLNFVIKGLVEPEETWGPLPK